MMVDEQHRKAVIDGLQHIIDVVKTAVMIEGGLDMERPSLSMDGAPPNQRFIGVNHLRYTFNLDVLTPHQSLSQSTKEDDV